LGVLQFTHPEKESPEKSQPRFIQSIHRAKCQPGIEEMAIHKRLIFNTLVTHVEHFLRK
jgi:hypothetical protein